MSLDAIAAALRRPRAMWAGLAALAGAACAYTALVAPLGADYPGPPQLGGDFAGPPIEALAGGHLGRFFASQPFMGPLTLLLRAPFAALTSALHAGQLSEYRVGCLACLALAALLACWLAVVCGGGRRIAAAVAVVLLLAGPITAKALFWGHPEELVGGLLCVAGIVLAGRGRAVAAGVALGLALATKQWALLAILPAAIAAPAGRRIALLGSAAAVAAVLLVPMLLGDPSRFLFQNLHAGLALSNTKLANVTPTNVWFALRTGLTVVVAPGGGGVDYQMSATLAAISHPIAIALGLGAALALLPGAVARRRALGRHPRAGDEAAREALLALSLAFLLRCLLDPVTLSYHHTPLIVALCCFELMSRRGLPWLALASSAALWALGRYVAPTQNVVLMNQLYLAWGLTLAGYLTFRLLGVARAGTQSLATPAALAPLSAA